MKLVDSHCHINWLPKAHDLSADELLKFAMDEGVVHFLCVCINLPELDAMSDFAHRYDNVHITVGQHPNEPIDIEPTVERLVELVKNTPKVVGVGETGLDYYRTEAQTSWQQDRFRTHIRAAHQAQLPIIIHSRQAREDTINIMREEKADLVGGVMHCFTEDWEMAKKALDLGFYISFSGIVTFKNAKELHEVAQKVPLDRMLIETDCPYLAPTPYRGKPNQPAYVKYVAEKIAELRGVDPHKIAQKTTDNFYTLFTGTT